MSVWLRKIFGWAEEREFWGKVSEVLKEKTLCSSGWNIQVASCSIGLYADAICDIKAYLKNMKGCRYSMSSDFLKITGVTKSDYKKLRNQGYYDYRKGDKVEITMRY